MRPISRILRLVPLLVAVSAAPAASQSVLAPSAFEHWAPPPTSTESRARNPMRWLLGDGSRDYRYPGFYVGAATGVALGLVALGFCGDTDSGSNGCGPLTYVLVPVSAGAILGLFGALVGGIIPK